MASRVEMLEVVKAPVKVPTPKAMVPPELTTLLAPTQAAVLPP